MTTRTLDRRSIFTTGPIAMLALTMLASSAAADGTATVTIGRVAAVPGEAVTVPVALGTDDLVGAFDFTVDSRGLVVAGVDYNGFLFATSWKGWDNTPSTEANVAAACIFPEDQVTGYDIHLLDLLVEVPEDAPPNSEIPMTFTRALVSDYSFDPYEVTVIDGAILIVSAACDEDVDGNGTVDFRDLLAVVAAWGPCEGECEQDVDDDGMVGLNDLLRVLAAWGAC